MSKPPLEKAKQKNGGEDNEELVHYDDSVIGRAFKGSVIGLVVLGAAVGGTIFMMKRKAPPPPPKKTELSAPILAKKSEVKIPRVNFTDATSTAGIAFVHNNGAMGEKLLPETMGGGVAFLDFDNDGDQDLLFVNSTYWPGKAPAGKSPTTSILYQNDGKGNFHDVTPGSGLDVSFYGMGAAVADYDNDKLPDILFTTIGGNRLFHNEGQGRFKEVTDEAGVGGKPEDWSTSAAWIDYDNDGKLDLFVCHYVKWSRAIDFEVGYKLVGVGRAYGQPMNFEGTYPSLYHNDGNGRFTDVSAIAGVQVKNSATQVPIAKSLGVAPVDIDDDGWIDLVVANDTVQNFVFHNQKNGTFKEVGAISGVAFDSYGMTRGAMGIDSGRFRNDQAIGIAIGNFANEMTALYVSQKAPLVFADEAIVEGIGPASRLLLKFGIFFFDFDLDGRLDVLTANGHLDEDISKIQQTQKYQQPAQLFWNAGPQNNGCFLSLTSEHAGADLFKPIVGRGSAFADIDGDGDLDVVLTQTGGAPLLLRNDQESKNSWVRLKFLGQAANRDAIGTWVKIKMGNEVLSRQVMPARSYLSQSELPLTIGLGGQKEPVSAEIVWPGGKVQKITGIELNKTTVIEQAL